MRDFDTEMLEELVANNAWVYVKLITEFGVAIIYGELTHNVNDFKYIVINGKANVQFNNAKVNLLDGIYCLRVK